MSSRVPIPKNGVDYRSKVVLAPMVRSGECPSRMLSLKFGADLVWGPETIDKALIGTTRRENPRTKTIDFTRLSSNGAKNPSLKGEQRESVIFRIHPETEGGRLIYQIGTSNPATAVEAAGLIAPDVAGIDVNAGCPKPFSTSGGMGAALLKTPDKLCNILRSLVEEVGRPHEIGISVKIRILETEEQTEELVKKLVATGITGLTVHCRTTPMRPRERAIRDQLKMIARVCREAGVACLMNGDVASRDEAERLIEEYECDGAMIATAAETNPSCFRKASEGGLLPWQDVVKEYISTAMRVENRWGNTKFLLGQMIPGKADEYRSMTHSRSYSELVKALGYDETFVTTAAAVDRLLEIGIYEKPKMTKAERRAALKADASPVSEEVRAQSEEMQKTVAGIKRNAEMADLEMPPDVSRDSGPATVPDKVSTLAI
ncbi:FMN-linked oxidoreductase [Piedraia hortae CBS 480.64]|uniref:FMN-linked oxidoreductase n=1 Tax=Piedraia hortae CBS 480.64 TaxID=1314780 RepID=A0A6A7BU83_9PEZI|nr:FMN-linked oxidoreductase [Piedraia hortae CBS 480.64]